MLPLIQNKLFFYIGLFELLKHKDKSKNTLINY